MTILGQAAAWHAAKAAALKQDADILFAMGVLNHRADEAKMHERFAVAIREADGDDVQPKTLEVCNEYDATNL